MQTFWGTTLVAALIVMAPVTAAHAQKACPAEVTEAEKLLTALKAGRPGKSAAGARSQDVQAPRQQDVQAPRSQDVQAPRSQDVQAPKQQDVQAPRSQDVQAPRSQDVQAPKQQDVQAPRSQDVQAPRGEARKGTMDSATRLVRDARKACQSGDMPRATANARAALELLHYLE